jgi:hypothetical protein
VLPLMLFSRREAGCRVAHNEDWRDLSNRWGVREEAI